MNWEECVCLTLFGYVLMPLPTGFPTVVIGLVVSLTQLVHGCEDRAGVGDA